MAADPYGDLDRAHQTLRRAAELVVRRYEGLLAEVDRVNDDLDIDPICAPVDHAGATEAVALLARELVHRPATSGQR